MEQKELLIVAMARQCRTLIQKSEKANLDLPHPLQQRHLFWMCSRIEDHAQDWPATKLHRWLGFIQCAMIANRMLNLDGAMAMFREAKNAYGSSGDDEDLVNHLDPSNAFEIEVGGQG